MKSEWRDTLLRLALPSVGIIVILGVARLRQLSFHDDLGLRWPAPGRAMLWFTVFLGLVVLEEVLGPVLGVPPPQPWGDKYSLPTKLLRVFAMVVLAPISEELLFRGLLYQLFARTALKDVGAILLTAAAFTALHSQYGYPALLFVMAGGLFYGTVRYSTGSVLLTMIFHAVGNAYAAYQRLHSSR
jgi:membrane protease YdiL (CAAX protease family)